VESGSWASKKRRRGKQFTDESRTRAGNWTRTFSIRQESWSVIEHWAAEHGFHLTALKGRRRLYRKGFQQTLFLTFLDVKHDENSVTLTGWIEVGLVARLLSGFTLPTVLQLEPGGFNGVVQRRQACREMNLLLDRMKQPPILGSTGLHIGDLDLTSMGLIAIFGLFFFVYIYSTSAAAEVRPGLSQALLSAAGQPFFILLGLAFVLLAIHHFFTIRRLNRLMWRLISVGTCGLIFAGTSLFFLSRTSADMVNVKVTYHCIQHYQKSACEGAMARLSPRDRDAVLKRLQTLEKQLTLKPEP
jgi:hypothetical protein